MSSVPPDFAAAAAAAEYAVAAAEAAVASVDHDPSQRRHADTLLGAAVDALVALSAAVDRTQAHARYVRLTSERDPERAAQARAAYEQFRAAAIRQEALGIRYRRADRRFLRFGRNPNLIERLADRIGL